MIFLTKAISSSSTRIPMGRSATTNKNLTTCQCIQNHSNKTIRKASSFEVTDSHSIQNHENTAAQVNLSNNHAGYNSLDTMKREIIPPASKLQKAIQKIVQRRITSHCKKKINSIKKRSYKSNYKRRCF